MARPRTDRPAGVKAPPSDALQRVRSALLGPCLAPAGTPLLLAVSGGADSVALAEWVAQLGQWPAAIAFVDHGLRDVAAERAASRAAAERARLPWHELSLKLAPGGNLQARARAARYRALLAQAAVEGALVATGHTATDQAETVLARLLRGAGVRGLAGLRPRQGRVIRPLLAITRAETRALGAPFADDPTNNDPRFTRNRLRALLPTLERENPQVVHALAALADASRGTTALIAALLTTLGQRGLRPESLPLSDEPEALSALLHHLAHEAGAAPSRAALTAWAEAARAARPTRVPLGDGLFGLVDAEGWRVEARPDPRQTLTLPGPGRHCGVLPVELSEYPRVGALPVPISGAPFTLAPIPGAQTAQRGLTALSAPVAVLLDRTGRALARARADGVWEVGSPSASPAPNSNLCFYVTIDTSNASPQSVVVGAPQGPLTSTHAPRPTQHTGSGAPQTSRAGAMTSPSPTGALTEPLESTKPPYRFDGTSGTRGLPDPGCAPTETESSSRDRGREG